MYDTNQLLEKERERFFKGMKLGNVAYSYKNKDCYKLGIQKAFDDAFNQYARRNKKSYKDDRDSLMQPIVDRTHTYLNNLKDKDTFDLCFSDCIKDALCIMDNKQYGIAQKFVNMTFKYLYCFSDSHEIEGKFADCHLPLDRYTIKWVRSLKDTDINKRLTKISNAWTNIDDALYNDIQKLVKHHLVNEPKYRVSYAATAKSNGFCTLPKESLKAEFIIWHQEQLNEVYRTLEKHKADFGRLGIQKV